jgi:pimeloyl-ACP methyl ester carboxylesterase
MSRYRGGTGRSDRPPATQCAPRTCETPAASRACRTDSRQHSELALFSGRTIDVPSLFIAGTSDWGVYQAPGSLERMREHACTQMRGCHLIEGAGHWVQQERVSEKLRQAERPRRARRRHGRRSAHDADAPHRQHGLAPDARMLRHMRHHLRWQHRG